MARPVCVDDYEALARARLPKVIFDYVFGGSFAETTLRRNRADLADIRLRQRVMRDVSSISTATELFGQAMTMPVALAPIGMGGMIARRGEVQAARAATAAGVPFCLSTLSICSVEEVNAAAAPAWFQLYMLKDRGFMQAVLQRAAAAGSTVLAFTVDVPVGGVRRRSSIVAPQGLAARLARVADGLGHPAWLNDVYVRGRPHLFGNVAAAVPGARGLDDLWTWLRTATDSSVTWDDLAWVRRNWSGPIVIKGILDVDDARAAAQLGAEGIIVSNHGGRQLDGAASAIAALPAIAEAVGERTAVLMDGGVRSGLDVLKALASGARACLVGRAWCYALGARGEAGVAHMLAILHAELRVAMALTGCTDIRQAGRQLLVDRP
jgi:L-lactate dehydrogenase (cytochrome)